ncbi:MAG: ABC transporter ATP-binding protein [Lacisediminimonas sp.]|nr:ABC transporter ATP-binding protein [Lacisediminimonas sp.]
MLESRPWFQVDIEQDEPIALDAHFACGKDEILALVGPSGSGKSTILKTIAGLVRPRKGQIRIGQQLWLDTERHISLPVRQRSVGVVFQDYALFPHLSALANVAEAMQHVPPPQRHERAAGLLARVHLSGLEQRRPAQLSGGQQQRVAVARALARDPAVLLLDEPFSAVDQVTREKLVEELAILHQQLSLPIVLVTHSLHEATMLADRMCILHRGRTLQLDRPEEIMNRPASVDVARLVALRNIFSGRVIGHDNAQTTRISWGGMVLETAHDARFCPGQAICWTIPDTHVVMHRLDKSYRTTNENVLQGTVQTALTLGNTTQIRIRPQGNDADVLSFSVPAHFAQINHAVPGAPVSVSLEKEAIHLMPAP